MVKRVFLVDDALDVLGVHGVGGALGSLLLPFLTIPAGGVALKLSLGGQFAVQAMAVAIAAVWSIILTVIITKLAAFTVGLRVDKDAETVGLDFHAHGRNRLSCEPLGAGA